MSRRLLVLMLIAILLGSALPADAHHVNDKLGPTNSTPLDQLGKPGNCQSMSVSQLHSEVHYWSETNPKRALWDRYYASTLGVCSLGGGGAGNTAGCLFTDQASFGGAPVTLCWWPDPSNPPPVKPVVVRLNVAAYRNLAAQMLSVGPNSPFPSGAISVNVQVTGQGTHTVHLMNGQVQKVVTTDRPTGCTKVDYDAYRWVFNKSPYMGNNREQMDQVIARSAGLCLTNMRPGGGDCTHVVDLGSYLIPGRGYTWACFYGEAFKPSTLSFGSPVVASGHTGGGAPDFEVRVSADTARTVLNADDPRATALAALADGRIVIKAKNPLDQMKINAAVKGGKDKLLENEPTCRPGTSAPGGGTWEFRDGVFVRTSSDLVYNRYCSPIGAQSTHHDRFQQALSGPNGPPGLSGTSGLLSQSPQLLNGIAHAAPRSGELRLDLLSVGSVGLNTNGGTFQDRLGALNPIWGTPGGVPAGKATAFGLGATSSSYMHQTLSQQGMGMATLVLPVNGGGSGE